MFEPREIGHFPATRHRNFQSGSYEGMVDGFDSRDGYRTTGGTTLERAPFLSDDRKMLRNVSRC